MYKKLEKILIILSVALIVSVATFIVVAKHKQMFAGADGGVLVLKAKTDIKEVIADIAKEKQVLIAKQIMVASTDGKQDNQPTFQKFGKGKLPHDFPEQKGKNYLENSHDEVYYFIFGKGIAAKTLSKRLNDLGNHTVLADTDWRFQGITAMLDLRLIVGTLLFMISYMALLMAQVTANLKKQGIQRLSGISGIVLAFSGIKQRLTFLVMTASLFLGISSLILYALNLRRAMYFGVLLFPALFWLLVLVSVEVLVGGMTYLFLQRQQINLVIKHRVPLGALMNMVLVLQLLALICLIFSFANVLNGHKEIKRLEQAQQAWSKYDYIAPSSLAGSDEGYSQQLSDFLLEANEKEELLVVSDNFNNLPKANQYFPTAYVNENRLYVSPNYLEKVGIKLDRALSEKLANMPDKTYGILIPDSQSKNQKELVAAWSKDMNLWTDNPSGLELKAISGTYQSRSQELFTFRMFGWNAVDNRSFVKDPLLIVVTPRTFVGTDNVAGRFFYWISRGQVQFSDSQLTASLIKKHGLENNLGSFSNGQFAVANRLAGVRAQQLFMVVASVMALMSAIFLISLMNLIYLYQNRKKFAVACLAGKSLLEIHRQYLTQLLIMIGFSVVMIFVVHLPILTLLMPFLFLGIILAVFIRQVYTSKTASLATLKGE
ncbi:bacteriocin transporter [Bacilli bacterium]|nr:bacteriocin transporter [Bacilli bacterium]